MDNEPLNKEIRQLTHERNELQSKTQEMAENIEAMKQGHQKILQDILRSEKSLKAHIQKVESENNALLAERQKLINERDDMRDR